MTKNIKLEILKRALLPLAIVLLAVFSPAHAKGNIDALVKGGAGGWLNVERPLTAEEIKGRVVLLDFWTYGCINCMQIVPDLDYLEQKFGDKLLIIGVHSAKFKGEQGNDRILAAAQRFGLKHPVINDSDFAIWKSYGVEAWPTQILLDEKGDEIERYSGEGHRAEIEADIKGALVVDGKETAKPVPAIAADAKDKLILWFPSKIVQGNSGDTTDLFFVTDTGHNRILGFDATGKIKVTIGSGEKALKDGSYKDAAFNMPHGIEALGERLIVADTGNHALREVDLKAGTVTTLAGTGKRGFGRGIPDVSDSTWDTFNGVAGKTTDLASPWDVKFIEDSRVTRLVVAMAGLHQLWLYDARSGEVGVLAGSGAEGIADGAATQATLAQPSGLSVDGNNNIVFVDAESSALRKMEGNNVKTLIGTGLFKFGLKDGKYPDAMLQHPQGVLADHASGKIYIADTYNNAIRIYDPQTQELSTLALDGDTLKEPGDILLSEGYALVVDTGNHAIKKIDLRAKSDKASDWGKPSGHIETLKLHF